MQLTLHLGMPSSASGFSHYVLFEYNPRSPKAVLFTNFVRRDGRFPKHVDQRSTLDVYLRHRAPWAKAGAAEAWRGYGQWRREHLKEHQVELRVGSGTQVPAKAET